MFFQTEAGSSSKISSARSLFFLKHTLLTVSFPMTLYLPDIPVAERQYYLQHVVAPRPICFAATVDKQGTVNLSPFSFFNLFSANPPVVIFSPSRRVRDNTTKHTLQNILEVPEVTINIVTWDMVQQTSLASCEYPKGTDEFVKAGFSKKSATIVKPPLVKESKVSMECMVKEVKSLGEEGGAGQLVICEIVYLHINDELLSPDKKFDQRKLELAARLGGDWYAKISAGNLFTVEKPNLKNGIGIDALPANLRNSTVLSGNDLGRLANVPVMPSADILFKDEKVNAILLNDQRQEGIRHLHSYIKELLKQGNVALAWQVALLTENC
ncbi:MAG: flavin reductase family protein [Flavitalea sp.]